MVSYFLLEKKVTFIVNAYSRGAYPTRVFRQLAKYLPIYSFSIYLSNDPTLATSISSEIAVHHKNVLVVMGGDGTINRAIQNVLGANAAIGLIPSGTANDLAGALAIPTKMEGALDIIRAGHVDTIDAVNVNNYAYLTSGGVGFPAKVAMLVNRFKSGGRIRRFLHRKVLKGLTYKILSAVLILLERKRCMCHNIRIEVDGELFFEGACLSVLVGKLEYLGKKFQVHPGMRMRDEGMMVSILKFESLWQGVKDLQRISSGRARDVDTYIHKRGTSFRIKSDQMLDWLGDGEILDRDIEFEGKSVSRALKFIVPRERP